MGMTLLAAAIAIAVQPPAQGVPTCEMAAQCDVLMKQMLGCQKAGEPAAACGEFVDRMGRMLVEYREGSGVAQPAIYSCHGESGAMVHAAFGLLSRLRRKDAKQLFASDIFRRALDGEFLESYEQRSCLAERELLYGTGDTWPAWPACRQPRGEPAGAVRLGVERMFDGKPYTATCGAEVVGAVSFRLLGGRSSLEDLCGLSVIPGDARGPRTLGKPGKPVALRVCGCEGGAECADLERLPQRPGAPDEWFVSFDRGSQHCGRARVSGWRQRRQPIPERRASPR